MFSHLMYDSIGLVKKNYNGPIWLLMRPRPFSSLSLCKKRSFVERYPIAEPFLSSPAFPEPRKRFCISYRTSKTVLLSGTALQDSFFTEHLKLSSYNDQKVKNEWVRYPSTGCSQRLLVSNSLEVSWSLMKSHEVSWSLMKFLEVSWSLLKSRNPIEVFLQSFKVF